MTISTSSASYMVDADEQDLLDRTRQGDKAAFGALYRLHSPAARILASYYVNDLHTVEDIVSEAFEKTLGAMARGAGPRHAFRAYLRTVIRHLAYERTDNVNRELITSDDRTLDAVTVDADPMSTDEERALALRAYKSVAPRFQTILWDVEVMEKPLAQIAGEMGIPVNSASVLLKRAKEAIRKAYVAEHVALAAPETIPACVDAVAKLPGHARGSLSIRDRVSLCKHLRDCSSCSTKLTALQTVVSDVEPMSQAARNYECPIMRAARTSEKQDVPTCALTCMTFNEQV